MIRLSSASGLMLLYDDVFQFELLGYRIQYIHDFIDDLCI